MIDSKVRKLSEKPKRPSDLDHQTKYLYSLDRNNNERSRSVSRSISREIELYIPVDPKWKLFCCTARRKKYPGTAQWSIFAIVKETENSQAAFHGALRSGEFIPAEPRCLAASDVSINFRQSAIHRCDGGVEAHLGNLGPDVGRGEKKKLPFYSISRSKELAREKRLSVNEGEATRRDRKTFAYTRTSSFVSI